MLPILDPVKNVATTFPAPVRDPEHAAQPRSRSRRGARSAAALALLGQRANLGDARQQPQLDVRPRRAALAGGLRPRRRRIRHSARRARIIRRPRRSRWSAPPATSRCSIRRRRSTRFVDTCYSTHHPQFGYDANDTLWTSGGGPVVGWLNTKMFDQTGDAAKSQGWTALVLDYQRQRQARCLRRARSAGRPDEGQADQLAVLRRDAQPG